MFDIVVKVLRLLSAIREDGDLSPRQYDFRMRRSIQEIIETVRRDEDYNQFPRRVVFLVTLDVKSIFNSARWSNKFRAFEHTFHMPKYLLRVMNDYLKDHTLLYETTERVQKWQSRLEWLTSPS